MTTKEKRARKRAQICAAYQANGDWRQVARGLNVPSATAYRWVQEGEVKDTRGGNRFCKVTEEHRNFMVEAIEANPRITLSHMVGLISQTFGLTLTQKTVWKHLDAMAYTIKSIRFKPENANTFENKEKRKVFVEKLFNYQGFNMPIVYMDETKLNIHISRSERRSARGTRCSTVSAGYKSANVHTIGAISNLGLIHYELRRGSFKKENAIEWVKTCFRVAVLKHGGPVVLVVDNAPCHSQVESVLQKAEFLECKILRLGPYSSMFNPIENIWSIVKSRVKRNLANKLLAVLSSRKASLSIAEQRLRVLEKLMNAAMTNITPSVCNNCIASIQSKITRALNLEDMGL
ncbi:hypothetical protein CDIK_2320 [Cucumispora dikerogammari]|nr:hypothetical protein CDIK_2320 [Cucumispora dikerogammari]